VARRVETQSTELKYDAPIAAWSPRGLRLAYARPEGIFVVNANGRGRRRVARRTNGILLDRLRWSADGRRLLFAQWRDGNDLEIYTVSADGSGVRALTDNAVADSRPSWAPDGTRLAFMRKEGRSAYDIWVVDASGGHERLVASNGVNPEWTADGRIVFSRGKWTYCVSVAGGDERVLMPARDQNSLSPDGTKVAFFDDGPRFRQLFVAAPNGAGTRPLTPIDLEERLSWSPDSSRIAFLGMDDAGTRGIDIIPPGRRRLDACRHDPERLPERIVLAGRNRARVQLRNGLPHKSDRDHRTRRVGAQGRDRVPRAEFRAHLAAASALTRLRRPRGQPASKSDGAAQEPNLPSVGYTTSPLLRVPRKTLVKLP
jgi:dipeptidyl aminopeptidase/acylaminoacyl peptidase